jgi:hypothetical protein
MIPADKIELAKQFAAARASAVQRNLGPDHKWRTCWFPALATRGVRNSDTPDRGYDTRAEAVEAARMYRQSCRDALAEH